MVARPTLTTHRKFARLARNLGSRITARGVLEIVWDACYESGDDYLGTAADIDQLVGWTGEPGTLALALVSCGLPEGHGFIEPRASEGQEVTYRVHDLWHHAPDYVRKRYHRERERREKTEPVSVDRRTAPNGGQSLPTLDRQTEVDRTPAPARAPAPALYPPTEGSAAPPGGLAPDTTPVVLTFPTIGKGPRSWDLTEAQCADWRDAYPGLDVLGECRKALAWVKANQPKTAKGMPAFLVNWFNRAVKSGSGARAAAAGVRAMPSASSWTCPHQPRCPRGVTPKECQHRSTFGEQRWRELYPQLAARLSA